MFHRLLLIIVFLLTACASKNYKSISGQPLDASKKSVLEQELKVANSFLEQENYNKALELFLKFKTENVSTPYYVSSVLGEARTREKLGQWSEAIKLYREVIELTRFSQPEIAAIALYQSSYCYEALGDEVKVQASLQDAFNLKEHLPNEIANAEIPARFAASYFRIGQSQKAKEYLEKAELAVFQFKSENSNWAAKTYFQMGYLSTNQLSSENFQAIVDTLKITQRFSLRSIEQEDAKWSPKGLENLKINYQGLIQIINLENPKKSLDRAAASRELNDRKFRMASEVLAAINLLRRLQMPGKSESVYSKDLTMFLNDQERILNNIIYIQEDFNELTPNSQKPLKRKYKTIDVK
jgi:tetratricopeptide (TPR) repeat protein